MAVFAIIFISNCSEIPENNDPVLGIWSKTEISSSHQDGETVHREEWIFNDAFLGRYHSYIDASIAFYTDFSWSEENGVYTIEYSGTDIPKAEVQLNKSSETDLLEYQNGNLFARRE